MKSFNDFTKSKNEDGIAYVDHAILRRPLRGKKSKNEDGIAYVDHAILRNPRKINESKNENEHIGHSIEEIHDKLAEDHPYTEKEKKETQKYTRGSSNLNRNLYEHKMEDKVVPKEVKGDFDTHNIKSLDAAVEKHSLKHDLHVYSGVHFHPGRSSGMSGHIQLPAYTSSSISKSVASHFAHSAGYSNPKELTSNKDGENIKGHILHLHLKPGQKGAYIAPHSEYEEEREYTLPRNTRIKINQKPTVHIDEDENRYHVWHGEVVPHK